jgi:elongation factor Ts
MAITADQVKELRERTGLGMMECKKALVETDGNIELAIDNLRKSGAAKADKKSGRIAAEGVVFAKVSGKSAVLVEVNSETDFVARSDDFLTFVASTAEQIATKKPASVEDLLVSTLASGNTLDQARQALVQKIGENVQIRRFQRVEGELVVDYVHNQKIGVLVALTAGDVALGKDIAMHIAATNPLVVSPDQVPEAARLKEKEIFTAQAKESGKPDDIIAKMIEGRLRKFEAEVSLVEQPFVKNPEQTIKSLLKAANANVVSFVRYEVGEGIEKVQVDFAAEVMAQVKG